MIRRTAAISPRDLLARQFSSLRIFNYRVYFSGQLVSLVGTWMQRTGQDWLVLKLTGSPLALGTVTALQFLPITVLTLFGGVFADRWPKRRILIITQTAALLQALMLAILVVTGWVELWHVYLLALWLGIVNAFDGPVRQAFVVELVGRDQLANAVALNSSIFNMARILGPAAGGGAIGLVGMSTAFFINAGSFVAVIFAYAIMRPAEFRAVPQPAAGTGLISQVFEGFKYSWRTPRVLFLFILLTFIGTFGYNFSVIIPLIAEFVLHVGPGKFGLLTSFMGAGSLIAALVIAGTGKTSERVLVISVGMFVALFVAVAVSPWYYFTGALLILLGFVSVIFSTTINTSLQLYVPDELRGRVMSIYFLLFAGTTPIGGYLTGLLGEQFTVSIALCILAGICGAGLLIAMLYRAAHASAMAVPPVSTAQSAPRATVRTG
ncbi:MAG: MFS transporter [Hyphomicrobiales bacterium]